MTALEKLKQNIHLQSKPQYTETEYFDALEAALANVAAGGGTAGDLDDSLAAMIQEFIHWCEDFVTDGQNVGIYDCFNDIDSRSWWVEGLKSRYVAMLDNVQDASVLLIL